MSPSAGLPATSCGRCGLVIVPGREDCPACSSPADPTFVDGRGAVVAATRVDASFGIEGFGAGGYSAVWVDLEAGPRVQALVDGAAPEPGARGSVEELELSGTRVPVFRPEQP